MAGFDLDVDTGKIDKDDDKQFRVVARDPDGNKVELDSITLEITEGNGNKTTTYSITDFSETDKEYTLHHTFTEAGRSEWDATVTDMGGLTERETDSAYIHP